ncbi:hypothetical protein MMC07_005478 [Pseudocyphellaria aurata]|nr:hypothetical protein [Pseudocyphellaria aurata]
MDSEARSVETNRSSTDNLTDPSGFAGQWTVRDVVLPAPRPQIVPTSSDSSVHVSAVHAQVGPSQWREREQRSGTIFQRRAANQISQTLRAGAVYGYPGNHRHRPENISTGLASSLNLHNPNPLVRPRSAYESNTGVRPTVESHVPTIPNSAGSGPVTGRLTPETSAPAQPSNRNHHYMPAPGAGREAGNRSSMPPAQNMREGAVSHRAADQIGRSSDEAEESHSRPYELYPVWRRPWSTQGHAQVTAAQDSPQPTTYLNSTQIREISGRRRGHLPGYGNLLPDLDLPEPVARGPDLTLQDYLNPQGGQGQGRVTAAENAQDSAQPAAGINSTPSRGISRRRRGHLPGYGNIPEAEIPGPDLSTVDLFNPQGEQGQAPVTAGLNPAPSRGRFGRRLGRLPGLGNLIFDLDLGDRLPLDTGELTAEDILNPPGRQLEEPDLSLQDTMPPPPVKTRAEMMVNMECKICFEQTCNVMIIPCRTYL